MADVAAPQVAAPQVAALQVAAPQVATYAPPAEPPDAPGAAEPCVTCGRPA